MLKGTPETCRLALLVRLMEQSRRNTAHSDDNASAGTDIPLSSLWIAAPTRTCKYEHVGRSDHRPAQRGMTALLPTPAAAQEGWNVQVVVRVGEHRLGQCGADGAHADRPLFAFGWTVAVALLDGQPPIAATGGWL